VWLSRSLIDFISITFGTWWGQTILVVGTFVALMLFNMVKKTLSVRLNEWRTKKNQKKIKIVAEEGEKDLKEKRKEEKIELNSEDNSTWD
jgi:hypothetical protein